MHDAVEQSAVSDDAVKNDSVIELPSYDDRVSPVDSTRFAHTDTINVISPIA